LLLLELLELLLNYHVVLLLLFKTARLVTTWLIENVSLGSTTIKFIGRLSWCIATLRRRNKYASIFLIIHRIVLIANMLNPCLITFRLNYLLNASREWSLRSSLHFMVNQPMFATLTILVLLKIVWSSLLKRVHRLQVSFIFSICVVSMTIHLGFGSLKVLMMADVVARDR
jgi:hypothetical protein